MKGGKIRRHSTSLLKKSLITVEGEAVITQSEKRRTEEETACCGSGQWTCIYGSWDAVNQPVASVTICLSGRCCYFQQHWPHYTHKVGGASIHFLWAPDQSVLCVESSTDILHIQPHAFECSFCKRLTYAGHPCFWHVKWTRSGLFSLSLPKCKFSLSGDGRMWMCATHTHARALK